MRTLSGTALTQIATQYGNEPITILDIAWQKDGSPLQYADRQVSSIPGKILQVGTLDSVITETQSQSQSLNVTLDDIDGSLKAIIDECDIHQRDVWVYQHFDGMPLADRFLLFRGQITSPVTYSEGDRTLSFTVLSQVEDTEIGFSAEEADFAYIAPELIGRPWPMCFGTTVYGQTLHLDRTHRGILAEDTGIADFCLPYRITGLTATYNVLTTLYNAHISAAFWADFNGDAELSAQQLVLASEYNNQRIDVFADLVEVNDAYAAQIATEKTSFRILGGEEFPRNNIRLRIGDAEYFGYFSGATDTFNVLSFEHPNYSETFDFPFYNISSNVQGNVFEGQVTTAINVFSGGTNANYYFNDAGSQVELITNQGQEYVVSITPGTVRAVAAYLNNSGVRQLVNVPSDYYSVRTESFRNGTVTATILTMEQALSQVEGANWEDDIYVTFESDIGPNTAEILEYLIESYSSYDADDTTFDAVAALIENYPSHFQLLERKQILQVLEEIAWQARCSIWLSGDKFYLRYLPAVPDSVATITDSDVDVGTLELGFTGTEELVTKLVAKWRGTGAQEQDNTVILRHNVPKYGTKEREFSFFIYNHVDLVIKAATFWLIRYANTWKRASFRTPLHLLNVESLDAVTLDFNQPWLANEAVVAIAEQVDYDSDNHELIWDCWTPVKAGRMVTYDFAYPADVDVEKVFPTYDDDAENYGEVLENPGGLDGDLGSPGGSVSIVFSSGGDPYRLDNRRNSDRGSIFVSDGGDSNPGNVVIPPLASLVTIAPAAASPEPDNTSFSIGSNGSAGSIDIRTTQVFDSDTGFSTTLDKFFHSIDTDQQLNVKSKFTVTDAHGNNGFFPVVYDEETAYMGAGVAFLYDETTVEET
jgi:hypothetical protein